MATQEQVGGSLRTPRTAIGAWLRNLRDAFRRPSEEDLPEGVFLRHTGGFGRISWRDLFERPSEKDLPEGVSLRGADGRKRVTPRRHATATKDKPVAPAS